MSKVRVDDLVMVDKSVRGEERLGKVSDVVPMSNGDVVVIVEIGGGELIKVLDRDVRLVEVVDHNPSESVPIDSITITRTDFKRALMGTLSDKELVNSDPQVTLAVTMTGLLLGKRLEDNLFGDKGNA